MAIKSTNHIRKPILKTVTKKMLASWQLYLLVLPALIYLLMFKYWPIYGVQIAFKSFNAGLGIEGSKWVGLRHFRNFLKSYQFTRVVGNTLAISSLNLLFSFPAPILFALLLNELRNRRFKSLVQTITYIPHFLSTVVVVSLMSMFLSFTSGPVNGILESIGMERIRFMTEPSWFRGLYIGSGIWQNMGWNSIIYIAAIAGINQELYEAAIVDGATRIERLWHITLPGILPTAVIMLIMAVGNVMSVGFDKVFLMQNNLTVETSEIISTYVYKTGLQNGRFDYATAIGLFNSVINLLLLVIVNWISRVVSENSLW